MSRFVNPELGERIRALMFNSFTGTAEEKFLHAELVRYVPQLVGKSDPEIAEFVKYQQNVYLRGVMPTVGVPIASLNPTFIDSLDMVKTWQHGREVYTRASVKENGYRMQVHNGFARTSAFTRQFTPYDLRMFPELTETFKHLPMMIGDAELVNKLHKHLAGFYRVESRIPNMNFWPKRGQNGLDEEVLKAYLADEKLFHFGLSIPDTELTLAFHGLYAIADPDTWERPFEVQEKSMESLCRLPIDYRRVDYLLNRLQDHIDVHHLNARVVRRFMPRTQKELAEYVKENERHGLEGTCVVQSLWDKTTSKPVVGGRSVKLKKYETLDCALLGLYLRDKELGLLEENVIGAMVGLYDQVLGAYLPAAKVNLDPAGVQIKTDGQRERLTRLRAELASMVATGRVVGGQVFTLYDAFLMEGAHLIKYLFGGDDAGLCVDAILSEMPTRSNLMALYKVFMDQRDEFSDYKVKPTTVVKQFIVDHLSFFQTIDDLDKDSKKRFLAYFSKVKEIKETSAKLVKPHMLVDTENPVILETQVFDLTWGASPYAAGFHSWFCNSFRLNNVFAERVRHDKNTTTDFATIHGIARKNSVRK